MYYFGLLDKCFLISPCFSKPKSSTWYLVLFSVALPHIRINFSAAFAVLGGWLLVSNMHPSMSTLCISHHQSLNSTMIFRNGFRKKLMRFECLGICIIWSDSYYNIHLQCHPHFVIHRSAAEQNFCLLRWSNLFIR